MIYCFLKHDGRNWVEHRLIFLSLIHRTWLHLKERAVCLFTKPSFFQNLFISGIRKFRSVTGIRKDTGVDAKERSKLAMNLALDMFTSLQRTTLILFSCKNAYLHNNFQICHFSSEIDF